MTSKTNESKLTSSCDAKRARDRADLIFEQVTRVGDEACVDAAARRQIARDVLSAEAVADGTDTGEAELSAGVPQRYVDDALDFRLRVLREPFGEVEACFLLFDRDGVTCEQVRHNHCVAVGGERVGEAAGVVVSFAV